MGKVLWKDSLENDTHIYILHQVHYIESCAVSGVEAAVAVLIVRCIDGQKYAQHTDTIQIWTDIACN